jgi:hypothetical protein
MGQVRRQNTMSFGNEFAAMTALLVLWTLIFFAVSCRTLAGAESGGPPSRIDNIYGGLDHQPTQSEVQDRERQAGVGLNTARQQRDADTVDRLYQQLLGRPATNPATDQATRVH